MIRASTWTVWFRQGSAGLPLCFAKKSPGFGRLAVAAHGRNLRSEDQEPVGDEGSITPADGAQAARRSTASSSNRLSSARAELQGRGVRAAGAKVQGGPLPGRVVFGVKEIPMQHFQPARPTSLRARDQRQPSTTWMLRRMMELGCNLSITRRDRQTGHRLNLSFGGHAGVVSMVEACGRWQAAPARRDRQPLLGDPEHAHYGSLAEVREEFGGSASGSRPRDCRRRSRR